MDSFVGPNLKNDGLILLSGVPVDLGVLPEFVWMLHETKGWYQISERSSGMNAWASERTGDQAIIRIKEYLKGLSSDQIATMRDTINRQKARNFELAIIEAGKLCPQL